MRRFKLQVNTTVDGYLAGPAGELDWMTHPWTDDVGDYIRGHGASDPTTVNSARATAGRSAEKGTDMRKLILRMLTSIDGFIADPAGNLRFGPHWSEEMQLFYADTFAAAGGLVYGRTVYEKYVPYWGNVAATGRHPHSPATQAEVTYAAQVRQLPKYVASTTMTETALNTTIVRHNPAERLAALKRQPGGDLLLMCGPALLAELSAHHLVDEYMLDIYPIALGSGVHLWRDLSEPTDLRLVRSQRFPDDVTLQVYAPKETPPSS